MTVQNKRFFSIDLTVDVNESNAPVKTSPLVPWKSYLQQPKIFENFFEMIFSNISMERFYEECNFFFDWFDRFFMFIMIKLKYDFAFYLIFALLD
jgi:hypothetical protein